MSIITNTFRVTVVPILSARWWRCTRARCGNVLLNTIIFQLTMYCIVLKLSARCWRCMRARCVIKYNYFPAYYSSQNCPLSVEGAWEHAALLSTVIFQLTVVPKLSARWWRCTRAHCGNGWTSLVRRPLHSSHWRSSWTWTWTVSFIIRGDLDPDFGRLVSGSARRMRIRIHVVKSRKKPVPEVYTELKKQK